MAAIEIPDEPPQGQDPLTLQAVPDGPALFHPAQLDILRMVGFRMTVIPRSFGLFIGYTRGRIFGRDGRPGRETGGCSLL